MLLFKPSNWRSYHRLRDGKKMKNLYDLMDYKRKNSILKSVYIGQTRFNKSYKVVEVNPYSDDKTALNALEGTPIKYKNAIKTIEKTLSKLEKRTKIYRNVYRIFIYSDKYGADEIFYDPKTGKEW